MKKLTGILLVILTTGANAAAYSKTTTFRSSFEVYGSCGEFKVTGEPSHVVFTSESAKEKYAMVGRGPTNDGANGCSRFKALLDCSSGEGTFTVEQLKGPIYYTKPAVTQFKCE